MLHAKFQYSNVFVDEQAHRIELCLVANPKDRFSYDETHIEVNICLLGSCYYQNKLHIRYGKCSKVLTTSCMYS